MKTKLKVIAVAVMAGVALGSLAGLSSCQRQQESALKPIDKGALQILVDTTARELLIPGAMVLLCTPQGEFTVSYGTTLLGATSPPGADTHFRIASNTKTMTAAVIVLLAQEGKLSLDDPVSYVPGVPNGDNVTITELLNMRSGLYTYDDPEFWAILERDPSKVWTPAEVLAIAFTHPPYFPPGTGYHYSNTNYALLGLIAEKIDGKPLASCLQDRLFGPLDLKDTLLPAHYVEHTPRALLARLLVRRLLLSQLDGQAVPARRPGRGEAGTLKPDDCTGQNSSYASAAGGVILTANDLAIWIKALVGGRVFNADYQRQWLDSLQPEDPSKPEGQKYGYGISQFSWGPNTIYFHGGEMPGFNSKISYDPTNKLTLIIWTNPTASLDGQQTANTLFVKMLDHIYKVSPLAPSPSPSK